MFSASGKKGEMYLKPFLLADIGEGITECEIVKWSVFRYSSPFASLDGLKTGYRGIEDRLRFL